jgi:NAD+ synthase (glutamine-hydrolysing)
MPKTRIKESLAKDIVNNMKIFYKRFFQQQFKRSCMPDGVKVGSISLSPRADWRMPSDADVTLWMKELDDLEYKLINY